MIKGYLIDPKEKTVTEIDIADPSDYKGLRERIGCDLYEVVRIDDYNFLLIDEEGMFAEPQSYFSWRGYPQPLAGKAIVLGDDDRNPDNASGLKSPTLSIDEVRARTSFRNLKLVGWTEAREEKNVETPMGKFDFMIVGPKPIFEEVADGDTRSE